MQGTPDWHYAAHRMETEVSDGFHDQWKKLRQTMERNTQFNNQCRVWVLKSEVGFRQTLNKQLMFNFGVLVLWPFMV